MDPTFVGTGPNLWHVTSRRDTDQGHGINPSFDLTRSGDDGGDSFFFGNESNGTVNGNAVGNLLSNPFSLLDYSAGDQPVLYFNYFVDNDPGSDAFRVSVLNSTGVATLIASSNTAEAASPNVTELLQTPISGWRQVRLDLSAFANQDNLRLPASNMLPAVVCRGCPCRRCYHRLCESAVN